MIGSKRAQAQQIFIFILAIVLAALIFLFGYRMIGNFTKDISKTALLDLQNNLEGEVRKISTDYGSVKKLELKVPSGIKKMCILQQGFGYDLSTGSYGSDSQLCNGNLEDDHDRMGGDFDEDFDPVICAQWPEDAEQQNVFIEGIDEQLDIKTGYVDLSNAGDSGNPGYICLKPVQGTISLRLEGKGNHTKVTRWPLES